MIQGRRRVFRSALPCALAALIVCVPFQSAMIAGGSNGLALRPYQTECVQRCVDRNTVVCMDTGTGKTLIAVKVIDHYLKLQSEQRILFLVPTKALVRQQAEYCRKHCGAQPRVKEVCGMETDAWDEIKWNEIVRNHEIIVGTPEPLRAAMDRGFLDPKKVSLVVLDECHKARGRDPMAEFIRIVKRLDQELRPRILGLTASFYAGKLKRKRDSVEGRLDLELLLDASLFCPDVPNGKQQEFQQVTWTEDVTVSSEVFEADFLKEVQEGLDEIAEKLGDAAETKDFRRLGKRMHHVIQQLGRQSLEVYVKKCVVRRLKQHCEELRQIQQLPAEERSNLEKLLQKLPLLEELTRIFYSHFTTRPCVTRAPKISAKVEKLSHIISKEQNEAQEAGSGGSKGIVFVEQVAITEPLAVALSEKVEAEAVYGMLPKKDLDAILKRFKEGVTTVLVSTNALEEGIDVADCTWVVRFDKIHTTKDHVQGSGRARADVARIYYFNNDPQEEVSKANVLKTVARDQSLTLTDEHRMQLEFTSVQEVSGVYPYNDGQPINLFNCQDIVTKWCQQALGPSFSADVFAMEPEVKFQIPTPQGVKIFKDDDVSQQWRGVKLDDVEPRDRLQHLSRLDRGKLRAFYTVAVWLREQKCLTEQNLPSPLQLRLTKSVCPLTARPAALRINGKFERTTQGGMAGDFKTKLQQLLQQRFPRRAMNELLNYKAKMEDAGWVARVVVHLPDGDLCQSSDPCLNKKEAEQAAARKAYEKLQAQN